MNKCQCGCGKDCVNRFKKGHSGKGKPRKPEHIQKMKEGWTDEKKQHHREINKGKTLNEDHRSKIGKGNSGKVRTDEVKGRIAASLKGRYLGDKNPFYKHGRSNKNRTARQTFEYAQWRTAVFKRDNYTCQDCGAKGVYVTAHHIKSFANHKELRYEVSNGKTLCEDCHCKTDNYKGKGVKKTRFKKKKNLITT